MDRKLKIILEPQPNTRTVFTGQVLPFMKGAGTLNLLCGNCNAKLIEGITKDKSEISLSNALSANSSMKSLE